MAAGLISGIAGVAVGFLLGGIVAPASGPVAAVGESAVGLTPTPVRRAVILAFGAHDKTVLLGVIFVVLALYAAAVGVLAVRSIRYGLAGIVVFTAVGLAAALSQPNATGAWVVPSLGGGLAAALALSLLSSVARQMTVSAGRSAPARPVRGPDRSRPASPRPASASSRPASSRPRPASPGPARPRPARPRPARPAASASGPAAVKPSPADRTSDQPGTSSQPGTAPAAASNGSQPDSAPPASREPSRAERDGQDTNGQDTNGDQPGRHEPDLTPAGPEPEWGVPEDWPPLPETLPVRAWQPGTGLEPDTLRRSFLTRSALLGGAALVSYVIGRQLAEHTSVSQAQKAVRIPRPAHPAPQLPAGSDLGIPGLAPFVTPNSAFYRVDTAIVLPEVDPSAWQLRIHGMVRREITLTFDELLRRPLTADYITLTCVSNPVGGNLVGNALWLGASMQSLLRQAGIQPGATQLLCRSADGFTSGTPVQTVMDGRDAMLAVAMNGSPLPVEHGFPVRLVVPGLYGYVSACKWITDIEVTTFGAARAYWVQNGWDQQAPIQTESRIDVPSLNGPVRPGRTAVAGVAWAQHKGVDAVEVQVDNGPWQQATLAPVPDIDTWRQWVWHWDATPGTHIIQSRATDATGYTQTVNQRPPEPNAATGYPSVSVQVRNS